MESMSFFRSSKTKQSQDHDRHCATTFASVQQYSYYRDIAIQSGHYAISSELVSLRHSRLQRSLYNLVYTPNDELDYFMLYLESCSLSSSLKFILEVDALEKLTREKTVDDQQTLALALFHKHLSIDANELVPTNDDIRRATLSSICPLEDSTQPDPHSFQMARDHVWHLLEERTYHSYSESSFHISYQLKLLTTGQVQLHDLLHHHPALRYLLKFAELECITDLIRFWNDVCQFYESMINATLNDAALTENAVSIYDRYISLQAPCQLGFDTAVRTKIECSICQSDGRIGPSADTFDQAAWIVYTILQQEYFPRFLQSFAYDRYTMDLMGRLRHDEFVPQSQSLAILESDENDVRDAANDLIVLGRQRTISMSSTCSSAAASFLVGNRSPVGTAAPRSLSMGYVDALGRFVRDPNVDSTDGWPSTNRRGSSKSLKFLSPFVRNEQDAKAEEEAASRFAQTLINEITNRTSYDYSE